MKEINYEVITNSIVVNFSDKLNIWEVDFIYDIFNKKKYETLNKDEKEIILNIHDKYCKSGINNDKSKY